MYLGKMEILETMHKVMGDICPWDFTRDEDRAQHYERMVFYTDGIHAMTQALLERIDEEEARRQKELEEYRAKKAAEQTKAE